MLFRSTGVANLSDAGALATKSSADWATEVAGTGKPANNADVTGDNTAASIAGQGSLATLNDVDWNSTLDNIPDRVSDTATTGLNLTDTYIGYYDGTDFKTYIQSNGNFHFGGTADNFIDFNGTQLVIDTDNFSVDGSGNASFSGEVTASTITGSTLRTATGTGRRVVIDSSTNNLEIYNSANTLIVATGESVSFDGSTPASIYADSTNNEIAIYGEAEGNRPSILGIATGTGPGIVGSSEGNSALIGLNDSSTSAAIKGDNSGSGDGILGFVGTGDAVVGNSAFGFAFYSEQGGYGPFTGAHDGLLPKNLSPESGDILCSTGAFEKSSLSQTIPYLEVATTANSKAAYGVFVSKSAIGGKLPAALSTQGPSVKLAYIKENYDRSIANALGEGQINVCSESGDFEVGDFICTSKTAGKGMRYDGQDMRYVVAKCMEPVVWTDEPSNIKMVACIYMCG